MAESDDNVVYIEFGQTKEDPDPLVLLEAKWTILDGIIRRHLEREGLELSLKRLDRIEKD